MKRFDLPTYKLPEKIEDVRGEWLRSANGTFGRVPWTSAPQPPIPTIFTLFSLAKVCCAPSCRTTAADWDWVFSDEHV